MEEILKKIRSVELCLSAHPDNEEHSEFQDRISDLQYLPTEISYEIGKNYTEGILIGLKICKEMFAQGTISHEEIRQTELFYEEQLKAYEP